MEKIDFKKQMASFYNPGAKAIQTVVVREMNFVMIDGTGDPNQSLYQEAIEALYSISYALKFAVKKETGIDFTVMPLEGLWWSKDVTDFTAGNRDGWLWTSLIMQPEYVTQVQFHSTIEKLKTTRHLPALSRARFEPFHEGLCAQNLYVGPYSEEGPVIRQIHEFITGNGYQPRGKHHEIYLSDPRRSKPEKLKTILRQPMEIYKIEGKNNVQNR